MLIVIKVLSEMFQLIHAGFTGSAFDISGYLFPVYMKLRPE